MRVCAFCSSSAMTREHLWPPKWLEHKVRRRLTVPPPFGISRRGASHNPQSWRSTTIDNTSKIVCRNCNSTWMSQLQRSVATLVSALAFDSAPRELSQEQQERLSAWAFMTAALIDSATPRAEPRFMDHSIRVGFRVTRDIPLGTQVWIAKYQDDDAKQVCGQHRAVYLPPAGTSAFTRLLLANVFCGHFALQVAYPRCYAGHRAPCLFEAPSMAAATVRVWPVQRNVATWPPAETLNHQSYQRFRVDRWRT